MSDRETIIKDCENWANNHKGENFLLTYSSVVELLALLKEQDAVEPEWSKGTPFCGNCGHRLEKKNRNMDGCKCPNCERSVKWK